MGAETAPCPAGSPVLPLLGDTDKSCPACPLQGWLPGSSHRRCCSGTAGGCRLCPCPCGAGATRDWRGKVGASQGESFSSHSRPAQAFAAASHQPGKAVPSPASPGTCDAQGRVLPSSQCCVPLPGLSPRFRGRAHRGQFTPSARCCFYSGELNKPTGFLPLRSLFPPSIPQVLPLFPFAALDFPTPAFAKCPWRSGWGLGFVSAGWDGFGAGERGRHGAGRKGKRGVAVC